MQKWAFRRYQNLKRACNQKHKIYPYLLKKKLNHRFPNQVWCSDITYVPEKRIYVLNSHYGLALKKGAILEIIQQP